MLFRSARRRSSSRIDSGRQGLVLAVLPGPTRGDRPSVLFRFRGVTRTRDLFSQRRTKQKGRPSNLPRSDEQARTDPLRRTRRPIRPSPLSLRSVAWRAVRRRSGRTATPAEAPSPANPVANISPTFPPLLGPPLALQRQKNRPVSASPLLSWTDLRRPRSKEHTSELQSQ